MVEIVTIHLSRNVGDSTRDLAVCKASPGEELPPWVVEAVMGEQEWE